MKALLIIDIQNGLTRNKKLYDDLLFIDTVNLAIHKYRDSGDLIVFLQHNNKQLFAGSSDWEIDSRLDFRTDDIVIKKEHGNAFENTELKSVLDNHNIRDILVCGLVSHGCVKLTCMGGLNLGYRTGLLFGGHTNWNKDAHDKIASTESELSRLGVSIVANQF